MTTPSRLQTIRKDILDQIASISTMLPGTLAEEWREHPDPHGNGTVRLGPYFKHQVWVDGRNQSRRVPAAEAPQLRLDIDNAKRFSQLTDELARLNFEQTRALRATQSQAQAAAESKKNSTPKPSTRGSPKPKPSSPKQRQR